MERSYRIIAVDFDGCLFETEYPQILRPKIDVIKEAKRRRAGGDKLILWTCREGEDLDAAVEACRAEGLEFDAVNDNLEEEKAKWGNNPRKVAADEYIDDKNVWYGFRKEGTYKFYEEDGNLNLDMNMEKAEV